MFHRAFRFVNGSIKKWPNLKADHGTFNVSGFDLRRQPTSARRVANRPSHVATGKGVNYQVPLVRQELDKELHQLFRVAGRVRLDAALFALSEVSAV
jgi:hypothetical protein